MKKKTKKTKAYFVSEWDGATIKTRCTVDLESGKIFNVETVDDEDRGNLIREWIDTGDGEIGDDEAYPVCPICHEWIMKSKMVPDKIGKGLHEEMQCGNPDCN